ncbi:MAG: CdaR family protein [Anaerolineaceae bacterium]|jgi:YbbR domain-containing protein|nr:CdaR family protein [Anaerolineaceae bacterium]
MWGFLRKSKRVVPTLLTALVLAITVWIIAVTASDPAENRTYPRTVPIEIVGQDTNLVMTSELPSSVAIVLNTPQSVWEKIVSTQTPVRAILDLSGVQAGTHLLELQIQVNIRPVKVVSYSPRNISVKLENLSSKVLPLSLIVRGEPAIGYQAEDPVVDVKQITVTGPISQVDRVAEVRATIDINQGYEDISRSINLVALDKNETVINNVTLTPDRVDVFQEINQRYGYRNVIVSVNMEGQVADGYRLTNISVIPLAVTVYSSNPQFVNDLPGYVETMPLNLNGLKDDVDVSLLLDLPEGVLVVGENRTVLVRVSIAAVQSSLPVANIPIEVIGLPENLKAVLAPNLVTLLISGPLPILDQLNPKDIRVVLDLTDYKIGTYQLEPVVELPSEEISVDSIQPGIIDIEIIKAPTPAPGG